MGYIRFKGDKSMDGLAGDFIHDTDRGSLGDGLVEDQSRLDLSSRETVPRDVDDILIRLSTVEREQFEKLTVYTTLDPDVAVLVAGSTVTSEEESRVWL